MMHNQIHVIRGTNVEFYFLMSVLHSSMNEYPAFPLISDPKFSMNKSTRRKKIDEIEEN